MKGKLFLFLLIWSGLCYGQKPALTLDSYKRWPEVTGGGLSGNGQFAFYTIKNFPVGKSTFVLKTTDGKELFSCINFNNPRFGFNSRYLYGILEVDTLLIYDTRNKTQKKIPGVSNYELVSITGQERLVITEKQRTLKIIDEFGNRLFTFSSINYYKFGPSGKKLFIEQPDNTSSRSVICSWIDMATGKGKIIYKGETTNSVIFDGEENQAAFIASDTAGNNIFYYNSHADSAVLFIHKQTEGIAADLAIEKGQYWSFSKDGDRIFFSLDKQSESKNKDMPPELEIWSYEDAFLRSYYNGMVGKAMLQVRSYLSTADIRTGKVLQLIKGDQRVFANSLQYNTDSIFLVISSYGLNTEDWNKNATSSFYLCNTKTGKQIPLEINRKETLAPVISPSGKYILYFDRSLGNYICFNIATNVKENITESIHASFLKYFNQHYPRPDVSVVGITGWVKNDESVLINTSYDIYKVDPLNFDKPVNITQGIGETKKTVFYLAGQPLGSIVGSNNGKVLLSAFNTKNKNYGFYEADVLHGNQDIRKLNMGAYFSGHIDDIYYQLDDENFIVAKNSAGYLLRWEQADKSPNYYFSKDLRNFTPISDMRPENAYNWLTAQLCEYKDSLGGHYQGILYKPENFDPNKKYPVIFNIYETKSNGLNAFIKPGLAGTNFNISLLVSNGYLVFLPDIRGIVRAPGEGALRSVLAAADYVTKFEYVDEKKLALVGHSFGGFETNYIITHSNRFAAAISGSGISDMVRLATAIWIPGQSQQWFTQYSYLMMEKPVVDDPESYFRNSPLLNAKKLGTPVLFMHNDGDENVSYEQTQAFFIVLRSLLKPCWWLNYKGYGHGVGGEKNQLDYNTRVWQFLDHYLKDQPMPDWMKEHI
ncbi:alpha/beta hydrolase family protein [Chitinophaga filiformis]|uniref:WD40-like Beta Propeller Repeat n=1 Tax=Chitinophaga filiformis TaxID=104663 RepID=A0A1G7MHL5_CHIFI|nr:prolyl oligopeptidase family serine peptidase [Chitinophaga filiformis]SDF61241.1 WD40-like Beta Propeller Repeat [Chitinophaga filiformis]